MKAGEKERVTFSPGEFAALFGKSQTWGYRQIYAGRVKTITEYGRILIPAKEVERILESAGEYRGLKKTLKSKAAAKEMKPRLENAWRCFLKNRREGNAPEPKVSGDTGRQRRAAAVERLARAKGR